MKELLFLKILLCLSFAGLAQEEGVSDQNYQEELIESHGFEEPAWEELTKDLDYSPFRKPRDVEQRKRSDNEEESGSEAGRRQNPAVRVDRPLLENVAKFLIILVAALALALLLKHFLGFGGFPRNKKIKASSLNEMELENIEENLHESELEDFIRQAIEQGQYALAIRLYFLAILKELSLKQAIRWKKNKTNREYLQELRNGSDYEDFNTVSRIFERIWYGNRSIDGVAFQKMEGSFVNFLRRLQREGEGVKG